MQRTRIRRPGSLPRRGLAVAKVSADGIPGSDHDFIFQRTVLSVHFGDLDQLVVDLRRVGQLVHHQMAVADLVQRVDAAACIRAVFPELQRQLLQQP